MLRSTRSISMTAAGVPYSRAILAARGVVIKFDSGLQYLVIASEAKQSTYPRCRMDCFVAALLAMTAERIRARPVRSLHVALQVPATCPRPPAVVFALL